MATNPFPDVSIVEVVQETAILEEGDSVEIITDSVEVASFTLEGEQVGLLEVGIQGPPGATGADIVYARRVDIASETVIYRGEAAPGSADEDAAWRIARVTIVGDEVVTAWAAGAAFTCVWSDRANLTYI